MTWSEVISRARGTTVRYAMWAATKPATVSTRARRQTHCAGISMSPDDRSARRTPPISSASCVTEKAAGLRRGSVDLVWINGANFRTAKQAGVLLGTLRPAHCPTCSTSIPWRSSTTSARAPTVSRRRTNRRSSSSPTTRRASPTPPATFAELRAWIHAHPGRFTYPAIPDFTGSSFVRHFLLHGGDAPPSAFAEHFDADLYARASKPVIAASS